jgi:FAD/FMN-containing dehydrogenase
VVDHPRQASDVLRLLQERVYEQPEPLIPRGLGRSYGDSSLADRVIDLTPLDHFVAFDEGSGLLTCSAGTSLGQILAAFVPRGWFLPVVPGTKHVTVGGAIASDVHGKNHHLDGSFSDHVTELTVATVAAGAVTCSPEIESELFRATCGGMGLTGVILQATLRLKPITSSDIVETVVKARNLGHLFDLFDERADAPYSVAWVDCLASGSALGRSHLLLGHHAEGEGAGAGVGRNGTGSLRAGRPERVTVPLDLPGFALNHHTVRAFNALYYHRVRRPDATRTIHYEPFFFPLDGIAQWNRLYGPDGFLQYQMVVPRATGREALTELLGRVAADGRASFLAVLKAFGPGNANYLSFPMEGYTLALDFKRDEGLFPFLDHLDRIVLDHGGRIYLTKDARMSEETFKASYPRWPEFMGVRRRYDPDGVIASLQSERLGI